MMMFDFHEEFIKCHKHIRKTLHYYKIYFTNMNILLNRVMKNILNQQKNLAISFYRVTAFQWKKMTHLIIFRS
jgi:hypothetical protein